MNIFIISTFLPSLPSLPFLPSLPSLPFLPSLPPSLPPQIAIIEQEMVNSQEEVHEVMQALEELAVSYDSKDREIEASHSEKQLLTEELEQLQVGEFSSPPPSDFPLPFPPLSLSFPPPYPSFLPLSSPLLSSLPFFESSATVS